MLPAYVLRGALLMLAEEWPTQTWWHAHDLLAHGAAFIQLDMTAPMADSNFSGCWIIPGLLTEALSSLLPADALSDVSAALWESTLVGACSLAWNAQLQGGSMGGNWQDPSVAVLKFHVHLLATE